MGGGGSWRAGGCGGSCIPFLFGGRGAGAGGLGLGATVGRGATGGGCPRCMVGSGDRSGV